jgi:hypothetical protein
VPGLRADGRSARAGAHEGEGAAVEAERVDPTIQASKTGQSARVLRGGRKLASCCVQPKQTIWELLLTPRPVATPTNPNTSNQAEWSPSLTP